MKSKKRLINTDEENTYYSNFLKHTVKGLFKPKIYYSTRVLKRDEGSSINEKLHKKHMCSNM